MPIEPYLFFEGRAEEAANFYKKALGAEIAALLRFKDAPEKPPPGALPPGWDAKVMHMLLRIGGAAVMGSDGQGPGKTGFQGFALAIEARNAAEANRWFAALADGGQVRMPLGETFFASLFGMVADRFGVAWMVIVPA